MEGTGSEQSGLARAWWRLSQGSTPAVTVGGDGGWKAQGSGGGSDWDSVVVCATPAVAGTAVVEAWRLRATLGGRI